MSATLIIMAAGLGSRYGGIKQMEGVGPNGEILLEYALYDARQAGFDRFVVILRPDIVSDFRERVGKKLEKHLDILYAVQDTSSLPAFYSVPEGRSKPFGTIHAVLCAEKSVHGPFAVLNADDFYGRDAFVKMHSVLSSLRDRRGCCMVAYRLGNTVSENGIVTRGVCSVKDGRLTGICETSGIRPENGAILCPEGPLDPDSAVSMNFWGFAEDSFADMGAYFDAFLRGLPSGELKRECLIPVYVGDRIKEGDLAVNVLTTNAVWFGMTYQADRELTRECLRKLHEAGEYPDALFV